MSVLQKLHFPEDVLSNSASVHIMENRCIYVENFRLLLSFEDDFISIKTANGIIMLCGAHFEIEQYSDDEIKISGSIKTISFGGLN